MVAVVARFVRGLNVVVAAALVAACSNPLPQSPSASPPSTLTAKASLFTTHSPAHPDTSGAVTLRARSTGTVDKVTLSFEVYTLSTAADGTHAQTLTTPLTLAHTCDPAGTTANIDCAHIIAGGFPANSLVRLVAQTWDVDGATRSESYSFAAGAYPWPNDPIPIRVSGAPASHMDLVFIPDTDLTVASFRTQLAGVIENLYFRYDTYRGDDDTMWRTLYNFYYSNVQGNYEQGCRFTAPANFRNLRAVADSIAILHRANLRDCKSGGMFSSEIDYDKTLVHETGHALFNLMDEYCCDSTYAQQSCVPNLYGSLRACQADAPNVGRSPNDCVQLSSGARSINFWRVDAIGAAGCIMGSDAHNAGSDHRHADRRRIQWRRDKCLGGRCYTTPDCP